MRFEGNVGLVTGGASGLGEATARLMVAEGGSVVIADLHAGRASEVASTLGGKATSVSCDVTKEDDIARAVDTAVERFGRLDAVFANAGIVGAAGPIAATPIEDFDMTMAVLARGVFVTVKHGARAMIACGNGGAIVCTASVAGVQGGLGPHVYSMAKSAVIGLARSAAAELAQYRIRVNAIAPGSIATAMTAHVIAGDPDALAQAEERIGAQSPLGRSGIPRDIAETAIFLMSEGGSYITGQTIVVDAGQTSGAAMSPNWARTAMVVARPM
jgi:NAD(P)-dependent dehydrogenase (short-subunit alcohol dehydrogenase family)